MPIAARLRGMRVGTTLSTRGDPSYANQPGIGRSPESGFVLMLPDLARRTTTLTDSKLPAMPSVETDDEGRARLVAFSGVDGSGKSTQIERLEAELAARGQAFHRVWARGGYTPGFNVLKGLMRRGAGKRVPSAGPSEARDRALGRPWVRRVWLWLAIADLTLLYAVALRWWRVRGRTVICDRYVVDTQLDFALHFPTVNVERMLLWKILKLVAPRPEVHLVMLLPVEESLRRCAEKGEPFTDPVERFEARLEFYKLLGARPGFHAIDARESIGVIADDVARACGLA